jgi:hypothetical protein
VFENIYLIFFAKRNKRNQRKKKQIVEKKLNPRKKKMSQAASRISITLYCSELAALLGCNRFVKQVDAWDKVFQRSFKFEETEFQKDSKVGSLIGKAVLEKIKDDGGEDSASIEKRKEYVKEQASKIVKAVQNENESEAKEVLEMFPEIDSKTIASSLVPEVLVESAVSYAKTSYGIETEALGLDKFAEIFTGSAVDTTPRSRVRQLNKTFKLYGKIDGMMDEEYIIEHKSRTQRLFYKDFKTTLYNYEYIQVQSYMHIFNKDKAYLVETLNRGKEINYRVVDYDADFFEKDVLSKLIFKDTTTMETIQDYYLEKNIESKKAKLKELFL